MKTSIRIFHTNDIHSNGAFLKKLHAYMIREKRPEDLYFDSGDIIDLQSPIVQADAGISETSLLVECGLDGIAVGNGETDLGHAELTALVKHFDCFMSANIGANDGTPVEDLPASRIYERGGIRILVIALSPYYNEHFRSSGYNVFTTMKNLRTVPPEEPFRRELERRKGQYDYCVLLSHSGHLIERELMKRLPVIDLCLGGHSHAVEHYPGYTQSGKGAFLGRITLEIEDGVIREVENLQIDLPEAEDEAFDALYREKAAFADRVLSEELPSLGALSFDPFRESPLINFICDALYDAFDVDLAIMHGGISEGDLTPPVSKKSLLETFPSKLNPAVFPVQ